MHRLRLEQPSGISPIGTKVYVDDREMQNVKSVKFSMGVDEAPNATIETYADPNFDADCDIKIILLNSEQEGDLGNPYIRHNARYLDLVAKIEDALRESIVVWEEEEYKDIARKIAEKLSVW